MMKKSNVNKIKEKYGDNFFSKINIRKKLDTDQIKNILDELKNRTTSIRELAKKYGVTPATIYYHARINISK